MDEWVLAPPLIGHESSQLPAFVGRHVGGSDDAVLPAASVNLLAWKIGPLATAVGVSIEAIRLLQRQIGQQATIRIDGEAVDVAVVDSFGVLAHNAVRRDDLGVVETREQVLAETPRQNRVEGRVGKRTG